MLMVKPATRLLLFHLYAICCFLLSYHVVAGAATSPVSFSFDFSNRSSYRSDDLLFEGNASLQGGLVDLTCRDAQSNRNCTGRMAYNHPVPFYDNTTREVASFDTWFNFAIKAGNVRGGSISFFLSSSDTSRRNRGLNYDPDRLVVVELDAVNNTWDIFIGRASVNTTSLSNFSLNSSMTASIKYSKGFNYWENR